MKKFLRKLLGITEIENRVRLLADEVNTLRWHSASRKSINDDLRFIYSGIELNYGKIIQAYKWEKWKDLHYKLQQYITEKYQLEIKSFDDIAYVKYKGSVIANTGDALGYILEQIGKEDIKCENL